MGCFTEQMVPGSVRQNMKKQFPGLLRLVFVRLARAGALPLLLTGLLMLSLSCSTAESPHAAASHSWLKQEHAGSTLSITGRLGGSQSEGFILIENPESRSRVVFHLKISKRHILKYLSLRSGESVTLTGVLLDVNSPWDKTLQVKSIQK